MDRLSAFAVACSDSPVAVCFAYIRESECRIEKGLCCGDRLAYVGAEIRWERHSVHAIGEVLETDGVDFAIISAVSFSELRKANGSPFTMQDAWSGQVV